MPDSTDNNYIGASDGWDSTNLGSVLNGPKAQAEGLISDLQSQINDLGTALNKANAYLTGATNGLNDVASAVDELQEAGIYYIKLEPATGNWINRLTSAPNAPRRVLSDKSAVFFSMSISASLTDVQNSYTRMVDSLNADVKMYAEKLKGSDISFPTPTSPLVVPPKPAPPTDNVWESMTLGKAFPGIFETVSGGVQQLVDAFNEAQDGVAALEAKRNLLQALLTKTQNTLNAIVNSGIYQFSKTAQSTETMPWDQKITNYLTIQQECSLDEDCEPNPNWPPAPTTPSIASAGFCIVILDTTSHIAANSKLSKVMSLLGRKFNR